MTLAAKPPCPTEKKKRGGFRPNAGRKKNSVGARLDQGVAIEVLGRIAELGLKFGNREVTTEADLTLFLMQEPKNLASIFSDMLNRKYGTAPRAVVAEGKMEIIVKEYGAGDPLTAEAGAAQTIM
jgi:hypothetical protein